MPWSSQSSIVVNEQMGLEKTHFTLKWTINDFRKLGRKARTFLSIGITMQELVRNDFPGRWRICILPRITKTEEAVNKLYVGAFLRLTDVDAKAVSYTGDKTVDAEFEIRLSTGKEHTVIATANLQEHTFCVRECGWGSQTLISHDDLFGDDKNPGLLKDDTLNIVIDVIMYGEPKAVNTPAILTTDSSQRYQQFVRRQAEALSLNARLQSSAFTIRSSDGQLFPTYRVLLMSHSPVFAAMLTHKTKDKRLSRCELDDVDGETVGVLLDYVCGCDVTKVTVSNAEKVLTMADKYQIHDLHAVCEDILAQNVTGENAVHSLVLASQRNLDKLKEAALNVIPKNMDTVFKNGALQEALQFDPELLQTIMEHCSKKMRRDYMP